VLLTYFPLELIEGPAAFEWLDSEIARMEAGGDPPPDFDGTREECIASMRAVREAERPEVGRLVAGRHHHVH
jgi:hypothetical protein